MSNNRGFTIIELITTFSIVSIIIIVLINISLIVKNIYNKYDSKTTLLIEQANLSKAINSKMTKNNLIEYNACLESSFCYEFIFRDGTTKKLIVTEDKIVFGEYVYKLDSNSKVEDPEIIKETVTVNSITENNKFFVIKIPIKNKLYKNQNFGVNVVYPYNSNIIDL